jgi:cytochrome c
MRRARTIFAGCVLAVVASLLLARTHPFGNVGLYGSQVSQRPMMEHSSVPPEVLATLVGKCSDCHSMQTRAPFYGRFAPVSWLMERDIAEGRKKMDLSQWETLPEDRRQTLMAKMVQEIKARDMPPLQYRMIHWDARITDDDVRNFSQWARSSGSGEESTVQVKSEGDANQGRNVFERRCVGCHSLDRDGEGPRLRGVYGRSSGSAPGFGYSSALKQAHIAWNDRTLEQWLADPDTLVPDNNMEFRVAKAQERQDLIAYLKQLSGG